MKKITCLVVACVALFGLLACGKKEITTDAQAREALIEANEALYRQKGVIADANFGVTMTVEGSPMEFEGAMTMGCTYKPEFSANMDMTISTNLMGMDLSFPFVYAMEMAGDDLLVYMNIMNQWLYTAMPSYSDFIEASLQNPAKWLDLMTDVTFVGKTDLTEYMEDFVEAYEMTLTMKDDVYSQLLANVDEKTRQVMELQLQQQGMAAADFDQMLAGITFNMYLRQSDLSMLGMSMDLGAVMNQVMRNAAGSQMAELPEFDFEGSMFVAYRTEQPSGLYTVPEEAKASAVPMEEFMGTQNGANPF